MLSETRAEELANRCLLHANNSKRTSKDVSHFQVSQLCRLWGGMGHIYKVVTIGRGEVDDKKQSKKSSTRKNKKKERISFNRKDDDDDNDLDPKEDGLTSCFIVKHVTPPHPEDQSFGDQRKAKSYKVEANFYQQVVTDLQEKMYEKSSINEMEYILNLPTPLHVEYGPQVDEITICMSFLNGFSISTSIPEEAQGVLCWLARFHASYWGKSCIDSLVNRVGLQEIGSYWHLDTRPEEHADMPNRRGTLQGRLKLAAKAIDEALKRDKMQCLIHGDPKEANIMKLDPDIGGDDQNSDIRIAMYDFQYCGRGTPTRDLAYFLCTSCHKRDENTFIEFYFQHLTQALQSQGIESPSGEHFQASLDLAFCDFHRFLMGWGQWGYDITDKTLKVLNKIDGGV